MTVANHALSDGPHRIAVTTADSATGAEGPLSDATSLVVQTSLIVNGTNPANGAVVTALPNGQFIVTFSHPLAGLSDGQTPIQTNAPFNPYDVFLLARGPDLNFTAPDPSVLNGGDLPLHADVVYHINSDGTSEFVLTPVEPLSTDVFEISINLSCFSDLAGNPLTDPDAAGLGAAPGYRTFLLQTPAANSQPLAVIGVTAFNGSVAVAGAVPQPDAITIHFNKPLFMGAADNDNVQLVANPGPNFTVVPSVAAYSPTTNSIVLTPTATLSPGTPYAIRVAGRDSGMSYVSDDQGFGQPDANGALATTFYDFFTVTNAPAGAGTSPLKVAVDGSGNPALLPLATNNNAWTLPVGYESVGFTGAIDPASLGHYSAMFIPWKGGLNDNGADAGDVPLNAITAFNPNTNQLIIVSSQPVGNGVYVFALSNLGGAVAGPLLNDEGQVAGVSGGAYYRSFFLNVSGVSSASVAGTHASDLVATPLVLAAPAGAPERAAIAGVRDEARPRTVRLLTVLAEHHRRATGLRPVLGVRGLAPAFNRPTPDPRGRDRERRDDSRAKAGASPRTP